MKSKEQLLAENQGFSVEFRSLPVDIEGFLVPDEKKIVINQDLGEAFQCAVIVHELCHGATGNFSIQNNVELDEDDYAFGLDGFEGTLAQLREIDLNETHLNWPKDQNTGIQQEFERYLRALLRDNIEYVALKVEWNTWMKAARFFAHVWHIREKEELSKCEAMIGISFRKARILAESGRKSVDVLLESINHFAHHFENNIPQHLNMPGIDKVRELIEEMRTYCTHDSNRWRNLALLSVVLEVRVRREIGCVIT